MCIRDRFDINCDFYVAGPPDFVATLAGQLRASGVPTAQITSMVL